MSTSAGGESILRLVVKLGQLLASLYLVFAMYNIGPHWILLVASLAVPLFGLYMLFRSPERILRRHPLPYVRYKAIARARGWLRVDLTICATMAVVCLAFAVVLLIGYFNEHKVSMFLLQAGVAALLLFLLYLVNALLSARQLQMGRVDFLTEKRHAESVATTRASSQSPLGLIETTGRTTSRQSGVHSPLSGASQPTVASTHQQEHNKWNNSMGHTGATYEKPMLVSTSVGQQHSLLEQLQSELGAELASGRWRHIPIERSNDDTHLEERRSEMRRVRVEKARHTPFGMDLGAFGSREVSGGWAEEEEGAVQQRQRMWNGRTRGGTGAQVERSRDRALSLETERRVRYAETRLESREPVQQTISNHNNVVVGRLRKKERQGFEVQIRPRSAPFRHSAELKIRNDGRPIPPHLVTEL